MIIDPEFFSIGSITENAALTDGSRVAPPADVRTSFTTASRFYDCYYGSPGVTVGSGSVEEGPALLLPPLAYLLLPFIENPAAIAAAIFQILSPMMKLDSGTAGESSHSSLTRILSLAPLTSLYLKLRGKYLMNTYRISISV